MATVFGSRTNTLEVVDVSTMAIGPEACSAAHILEERKASGVRCLETRGRKLSVLTDESQKSGRTEYSVAVWLEGRAKS